ncbi:hypothetical protein [Halopolyspora algeriensis]|uniref:hypothetical protein n=1 Tax=Halopolyspora algeriensis TaxID=1500506 RepID=UPI001314641A|nr:hypothetical protein [Halopolyspora algeriensis]
MTDRNLRPAEPPPAKPTPAGSIVVTAFERWNDGREPFPQPFPCFEHGRLV